MKVNAHQIFNYLLKDESNGNYNNDTYLNTKTRQWLYFALKHRCIQWQFVLGLLRASV